MTEDGKFYSVCWICLTIIFISLMATIGIVTRLNTKEFIRAGYTQEVLPGSTMARWVKK